jgi:hypothetical protein
MKTDARTAEHIEAYVARGDPRLRRVARALRSLIRKSAPSLRECVNPWGVPTFEGNGPVCFWMVGKNHVTLGFMRGTSLEDPRGLLEGTGKNLRHVKLRALEDLERPGLRPLIASAVRVNRREPGNPTGRPASAARRRPAGSRRAAKTASSRRS